MDERELKAARLGSVELVGQPARGGDIAAPVPLKSETRFRFAQLLGHALRDNQAHED